MKQLKKINLKNQVHVKKKKGKAYIPDNSVLCYTKDTLYRKVHLLKLSHLLKSS